MYLSGRRSTRLIRESTLKINVCPAEKAGTCWYLCCSPPAGASRSSPYPARWKQISPSYLFFHSRILVHRRVQSNWRQPLVLDMCFNLVSRLLQDRCLWLSLRRTTLARRLWVAVVRRVSHKTHFHGKRSGRKTYVVDGRPKKLQLGPRHGANLQN
jgi:hypothetical protein